MSGSAATVYDLTPFPPPPSPPRAGLFGWIKSHVSPKQSTSTELIYSYESPIAPDSSSPSQSPQQNPRPLIARQIQSRRRPPNGIYRYSSELDPSTSHTRVTEHENTGLEMIHFPQRKSSLFLPSGRLTPISHSETGPPRHIWRAHNDCLLLAAFGRLGRLFTLIVFLEPLLRVARFC